jgi:hypothetical protein
MHEKHQYDLFSISTRLFCLRISYEYSESAVQSETNLRIHIGRMQNNMFKETHRQLARTHALPLLLRLCGGDNNNLFAAWCQPLIKSV